MSVYLERAAIERLAYKYATLGELRRKRACGDPIPQRHVFRDLAKEFPGVLNELDNLPLDQIDHRLAALQHALTDGPIEPWMAWMHAYHTVMRAALYIKIRLANKAADSDARIQQLAADANVYAGTTVDDHFVRAVQHPPGGRLNHVVFQQLQSLFAQPSAVLRNTLFPRRKAG